MTCHQQSIVPTARKLMTMAAIVVATLSIVRDVEAQESTIATASAQVDAVVARARVQLDAGEGAAARALMDSLVEATASGSLDKGEALFWRAAFSEQASDAEKDWRLLLIDVPLSPRVADAALRLAELERARGRAQQSRFYVTRLLRDHPTSPLRSRALLQMARSYFDESDQPHACGVLNLLRTEMPPNATEVKLQTDELALACRGVAAIAFSPDADAPKAVASSGVTPPTNVVPATAAGSPPTTVTPPATSATAQPPVTTPPVSTPPVATPPVTPPKQGAVTSNPPTIPPTRSGAASSRDGRWSVQLAAYDVRSQADALVKRLSGNGIDARVDGDAKPFRVRVGHYATQADAVAALAKLKTKGQGGFVTEVNPR